MRRLKIVDFGSGSGNLVLPLAHMFPGCDFVAVDMKAEAIEILRERVADACMKNVSAQVGRIEDFRCRSPCSSFASVGLNYSALNLSSSHSSFVSSISQQKGPEASTRSATELCAAENSLLVPRHLTNIGSSPNNYIQLVQL